MNIEPKKRVGRGLLLALCMGLLVGPGGSWSFTGLKVPRGPRSVAMADGNAVIGFGKHKDQTIADVMEEDPEWIEWVRSEPDTMGKMKELQEMLENMQVEGPPSREPIDSKPRFAGFKQPSFEKPGFTGFKQPAPRDSPISAATPAAVAVPADPDGNEEMGFGRYKHMTIAEVIQQQPVFIEDFMKEKHIIAPEDSPVMKQIAARKIEVQEKLRIMLGEGSPSPQPTDSKPAFTGLKQPAPRASLSPTSAAPAAPAAPAVRGSPARKLSPAPPAPLLSVTGANADFFEIPRGLLEEHQIWSCQGNEWTREEGDPWCWGTREWRFVTRVVKTRTLAMCLTDQAKVPSGDDCRKIEESELDAEQYARFFSALLEEESKTSVRTPEPFKLMGKDMELMRKFRFRGVSMGNKPYVAPILENEIYAGESLNLGGKGRAVAAFAGLKVRPLGPPQPWFTGLVICDSEPEYLTEDRRQELLKLTKTPEVVRAIQEAAVGELVLEVSKNCTDERDLKMSFVANALRPSLTGRQQEEKLQKLKGWESWQAPAPTATIMKPQDRQAKIADEIKRLTERSFPGKSASLKRLSSGDMFEVLPAPTLVFGRQSRLKANGKGSEVSSKLRTAGPFKIGEFGSTPISLHGLIFAGATKAEEEAAKGVLVEMQKYLKRNKITTKVGTADLITVGKTPPLVSAEFRKQKYGSDDAVLIFGTRSVRGSEDALYDKIKWECLRTGSTADAKRHTASQWFDLTKEQVWNPKSSGFQFAVGVCGAGMLAKLGHVPWALDSSSWHVGSGPKRQVTVVGYDVCHKQGSGIRHIAAGVRVATEDDTGILSQISYSMQRVHGETVPKKALEKLIPAHLARKRIVVIHRDGKFTRDEVDALRGYYNGLSDDDTTFILLEVVKHAGGTPRIYDGQQSPKQGLMLKVSDKEVILATSKELYKGTANPLNIRLKDTFGDTSDFDMDNFAWAKTVFDLSYLHHGSTIKRPRLPVTTHFADRLAGIYASAGEDLEIQMELTPDGTQQFWL
eukprot:CAMPEP_0197658460 /NCGR_PEP_ID=MMETSP1338-20131121/45251_1 /TAXON_ID=43686 ORGANISM="Pelagodinium beii, Strain RCC1491" /NCGR_SAMPLE_ID=MMETSP1338 /ASSEMBLY_ACC=CAM_ASM_000754 /LENGTH=1018 /DNA_ID=CAMNT_0043235057 /DNA_START=100 /DNA_END=3156 /DNA_ORIENTATION=+